MPPRCGHYHQYYSLPRPIPITAVAVGRFDRDRGEGDSLTLLNPWVEIDVALPYHDSFADGCRQGVLVNIVVFEDELVPRLEPVTTGRPAFAVSCASFRLIDWLRKLSGRLVTLVRPHLAEIVPLDFPDVTDQLSADVPWTLLVNARLVPSLKTYQVLQEIAEHPGPIQVTDDQWLLAAKLETSQCEPPHGLSVADFQHGLRSVPAFDAPLRHLMWLHDLIKFNSNELAANLQYRIEQGEFREIRDGVFAAPQVSLSDEIVTRTDHGPIVAESGVTVDPFTMLEGPVFLDRNSRINAHSAIKDGVSIGHTSKVGGEVEASVIEPYTNKQHAGFLGHSYLGSWINLGAGTCNSDLKNTYGSVAMNYGSQKVSTEMQFVGCFVGDYAKTAINTSIFTGKRIGVGSMVYGYATTDVPDFVNYGRTFGKMTEISPEVIVQIQARMLARRNVEQRSCDIQLIHDMFELTQAKRPNLPREPLAL